MGDRYVWVDVDGLEHNLPVVDPKAGAGMPPVALTAELVPEQPGARFRQARHDVRVIDLPLAYRRSVHGDADQIRSKIRNLFRAIDPVRGAGRLRRIRPSGDARELIAYYDSGLELEEADPTWVRAVATFRAFDPYWRDAADRLVTFGGAHAFFPIPPLRLAPEAEIGQSVVVNDGDVESWPVWEIVGPGNSIRLVNDTTGEVLELTDNGGVALAAGQTLTVDTRPGEKTVTRDDGTNLYPNLTVASSLWPLRRGSQTVTVEVVDTTDESRVNLRYRRRFLGA